MKTFNESFIKFKKEYSYDNLFLGKKFNKKMVKEIKFVLLSSFVLIGLGMVLSLFSFLKTVALIIVGIGAFSFVIILIRQHILTRKELVKNEFPVSHYFYKWKSEELNNLRIHRVYEAYETIDSKFIISCIKIAKNLKEESIKNPFIMFDKAFGYFLKNFAGVITGYLVAKITSLNFNETLKLIFLYYASFGVLFFIWEGMIKKMYFDNTDNRNQKLKDYIFVMENIILLKEQEK